MKMCNPRIGLYVILQNKKKFSNPTFRNRTIHFIQQISTKPTKQKEEKKSFDLWSYKPVGQPLNHCAGRLSLLGWRNEQARRRSSRPHSPSTHRCQQPQFKQFRFNMLLHRCQIQRKARGKKKEGLWNEKRLL